MTKNKKYKNKNEDEKQIKKIIIIIIVIISIFIFSFAIRLIYIGINKSIEYASKDNKDSKLLNSTKIKDLEEDIDELKKMLELKDSYSDYNRVYSTVISRNREFFLDNLVIDKGSKDGIKKGNLVINYNGLIGKIEKVNKNTSIVKLISNNDKKINILVSLNSNNKDYYGVLCGYDEKEKLIKVCDIEKASSPNVGDEIKTSNLSNSFPSGIFVGKVEKVQTDRFGLSCTLYLKSNVNFNNIHYVYVVGR